MLHINLHFIHYVPSEFSLASKVSCLEAGEDPWLVVQPERTCPALTEHYDNEKKSLESRTPLVAGFFVVNIYYSSSGRDLQYSEGILNLFILRIQISTIKFVPINESIQGLIYFS